MSTDPLDVLRSAAPAVARPTTAARESAYRAAVAQSPVAGPASSLRRWWVAMTAAVSAAVLTFAGTTVAAAGQPRDEPVSTSGIVSGFVPSAARTVDLSLTRPDGTVYRVTRPGLTTPEEDK